MQVVIRPVMDPLREIDVTRSLVAAIAQELWRLYGGNDELNWLEAEAHLQRIITQAKHEAVVVYGQGLIGECVLASRRSGRVANPRRCQPTRNAAIGDSNSRPAGRRRRRIGGRMSGSRPL